MSNKKSNEELEDENKRKKRIIIILIIIIIILLLLLFFLGFRVGKIGYSNECATPVFGEKVKTIRVSDKKQEIDENTSLDIFSNIKFDNKKIIAPGSFGSYDFMVKNTGSSKLSYNIEFKDIMDNPVNMKYRLKIDNVYIKGNENEYVTINELNTKNIKVMENSNNVFTLEWLWEHDNNNDTYTGSMKDTQYYTLNINVSLSDEE